MNENNEMKDDVVIDRVMVDLETLATGPRSVVFCGCVAAFDKEGKLYGQQIFRLHLAEQVEDGRKVDADTMSFWVVDRWPLFSALMNDDTVPEIAWQAVARVLRSVAVDHCTVPIDKVELWCRGTSFDMAILRDMCDASGQKPWWKYWNERDVRTYQKQVEKYFGKDVCEVGQIESGGEKHDPFEDVSRQALLVAQLDRTLRVAATFARPRV